MESFSGRDNVLLGYIPRKSRAESLDVDFEDVFGGPPRRSSIHNSLSSGEDMVFSPDPWSGLSDKPVFGEEIVNRKKHPSDDFFDDIFRGDESSNSTPRKLSRDPFSSSPSSRVSSPARSRSFQSESFRGSSLSLPPLLSLPVKLAKEMDSSAFPTQSRNPRKNKETALIDFPSSPGASTSRFSIQVIQGQEGFKNDSRSSYQQSSLSKEVSLNSEGSAQTSKSFKQESEDQCTEDSSSSEVTYNSSQFHFSIYKWPSTVVPLAMLPFREANISSSKESSKTDNRVDGNASSDLLGVEIPTGNYNMLAENESFRGSQENQDDNAVLSTKSNLIDSSEIVKEVVSAKPESKPLSNLQNIFKKFQDNLLSQNSGKDNKNASGASGVDVGSFGSFLERRMPVSKNEVCKSLHCLLKDIKDDSGASGPDQDLLGDKRKPLYEQEAPKPKESLYSLLQDDSSRQGNAKAIEKESGKEATVKSIHTLAGDVGKDKRKKKKTGMRNTLNLAEATSSRVQDAPIKLEDKPVNNKIKAKVKDVVSIFNQEAPSKSSRNVETRDQDVTATDIGAHRVEDQANVCATKIDQKNNRTLTDTPGKVDRSSKQFDKPQREIKTAAQIFDFAFERNNSPASCSETILENLNVEEFCEDFECTIKELSQDQKNQPQNGQTYEEVQASDSRIRKWSNGKEGNIRSLLSTLQYVLWPESGWKPVPLVDIIEGSSVRRAYQKALLCLHPDKLQQKGATPNQKYIAEKVFDILQEAWTHFNALGSFL